MNGLFDSSTAKRQNDESLNTERLCELADRVVREVSDLVYSPTQPTGGDIIQYFGDSLVVCLPGEEHIKETEEDISISIQGKVYNKKERKE